MPAPDGFEVAETLGNQGQEVFQQDRLSAKNDNRDFSLPEILLIFESAIDGQDNIESCRLGRAQKLTILKSSKASVSGCLTIMSRKVVAQFFVHALVEQNPHSRLSAEKLLRLL